MLKRIFSFLKANPLCSLIVVFAVFLRFFAVNEIPPSLNWDEVSHGYNAYSILKSGKDEWGEIFPLIFRAFGDYKLPIYIYLTALSEFIFGLTAFAVRLPSVIAGIGSVVFTYFLVKKLSGEKILAIVSSLLIAIEPWSLFLSRGAFEANVALFFIISGVYFFFIGFDKPRSLILSIALFGLSVWTYNSARIFVPLLIVLLSVIYYKEVLKVFKRDKKLTTYILFFIAIFFIPMFYQLLNPVGQARFSKVSIIDEGALAQIVEARQNSSYSPVVSRFLYNRPLFFLLRFTQNWALHFTCSFLFFKGGSHYQFSVPGHGLLYLVNLPFFFLGLILLLKKVFKRDRIAIFLLSWMLIAPIPSSLTREAPHVLRSITLLPIPMILTGYGLVFILDHIKRKYIPILIGFYLFAVLLSLGVYLSKYFGEYKDVYSWSWQFGYKQVVNYAKQNYDKYDKIIVTKKYGEPHEFFLFHWPWDPEEYRNDKNLIRFYQSNWYWVDAFDKFYFVNDWELPKEEFQGFKLESGKEFDCFTIKCLLVTSQDNAPKNWNLLETIYFLDGNPGFSIYEN